MKKKVDELQMIPGIGKSLADDLRLIGICKMSDLKGKDPEKLYRKFEQVTGTHQDRCVLYTFRCAVYFVNEKQHNPRLLKWWSWSDENLARAAGASRKKSL